MSEPIDPTLGVVTTGAVSGATSRVASSNLPEPRVDEVALEFQRERLLLDMFGVQAQAPLLSHYALIKEIGRGGMGVVYEAYDRKLDRRVALKLLDRRAQGMATFRLDREAQGLAKLSHPNVVQIHEIGEHEGADFLVMEFIVGETLREWATKEDERGECVHSRAARIEVLLQAGRGLAAAHAAGLVHRDFKPDNVMVGEDGRARVLDFGLVRGLERAGEGQTLSSKELLETVPTIETDDTIAPDDAAVSKSWGKLGCNDLLRRSLTRTGTVMGTPAYMAPEQFLAQPCDALTDQFAFCVAAFEVLLGERPFFGRSLDELQKAVCSGSIQPAPEGSVPRHLRAAILRGLSTDPAQRWPNMDALLEVFDEALDPGRRSRRLAWGFGAAALLAGAVAGWSLSAQPEPALCAVDMGALAGTWDEERRAQLRAGFESSGLRFAATSFELVAGILDEWSVDWVAERRAACLATRVEGTQSELLLDRRMACLDRKRREAEAVIEILSEADGDRSRVTGALELLDGLPTLDACADPALLDAPFPLPPAPEQAAAILAGFEEVARARALLVLGDVDGAAALRAELLAGEPAAAHPPLRLEVEALAAREALLRGDFEVGVPDMLALVREAEGLRLDRFVADHRVLLAKIAATTWGDPAREADLVAEAEAAMRRVGGDHPRREYELNQARARLLEQDGELEQALAMQERAIAAVGELPPHNSIRAQQERARLLAGLGRLTEAEAALATAREHADRLGEDAPAVANLEFDHAMLALERGDFEAVGPRLDRAEASRRRAFGEDSRPVAEILFARGKLAMVSGELDEALNWVETAGTIYEAQPELGPGPLEDLEEARGVLRFFAGDFEDSLVAYAHSLRLRERRLGPEHPAVAQLHSNIGESRAALGDHPGALEAYERALSILGRSVAEDDPAQALPLKGCGQSRLALGEVDDAVADLERALLLVPPGEPFERADIQAALARALHLAGHDPPRVRELADQAASGFYELGMPERTEQLEHSLKEDAR